MSLLGGIVVRLLSYQGFSSVEKLLRQHSFMDVIPSLETAQRRSSVVPMLFILAVVVDGGDPWGLATAWLEAVYEYRRGGTCSCIPMTKSAAISS